MLKSFIFLWVSLVAESSSCQCLSAALKVLDWCFTSRFSKRTFVPGILHRLLAERHRPAEHSSASLPTVPALTYLVPQQSWEWGCSEYAFHNSFFLRRAAFWLCTLCFTLSFGNLIYCARGVRLGKWNRGSELWWGTAKQWNHLQLCSGKCIPLKVL